jgi:rubrerythrin
MRIVHAMRFAVGLSLLTPLTECAPPPARVAMTAHRWVCAPCRSSCDGRTYDHPGRCPTCGMPLVEEGTAAKERIGMN